jgi:hypothetical protein
MAHLGVPVYELAWASRGSSCLVYGNFAEEPDKTTTPEPCVEEASNL